MVATTRFRLDLLCNRIADLALKKSDLQLPAHEAFVKNVSKFDKRLLVRGFKQRFKDAYSACFSKPKAETESTIKTSNSNAEYTPGCPSGLREVVLAALSSLDTRIVTKILSDHIAQPPDLPEAERERLDDSIDRLRKTYPVTEVL